jgi:hypothetical protein
MEYLNQEALAYAAAQASQMSCLHAGVEGAIGLWIGGRQKDIEMEIETATEWRGGVVTRRLE